MLSYISALLFAKSRENCLIVRSINVIIISNTLQSLLGSPKNKVHYKEKLRTYETIYKDCVKRYVGQTRRSIKYDFQGAHGTIGFNVWRSERSRIAQRISLLKHLVDLGNL